MSSSVAYWTQIAQSDRVSLGSDTSYTPRGHLVALVNSFSIFGRHVLQTKYNSTHRAPGSSLWHPPCSQNIRTGLPTLDAPHPDHKSSPHPSHLVSDFQFIDCNIRKPHLIWPLGRRRIAPRAAIKAGWGDADEPDHLPPCSRLLSTASFARKTAADLVRLIVRRLCTCSI